MRKKLDTRFPAARIKKIMQADEDIGKIALAVPVLVSKALELFLQDLCDHTYDITLRRGAKTMSALHLKHCVQNYNVFDFLRDVVSQVPDYGHGYGHGRSESGADDRAVSKRRKAAGYNYSDSDEESKRSKMHGLNPTGSTGRGRGRGRRRGRGQGARTVERENYHQEIETEPSTFVQHSSNHNPNTSVIEENGSEPKESPKENTAVPGEGSQSLTKIDLNSNTNEAVDKDASTTVHATVPEPATETKLEEISGWSISDVDKMVIDSVRLVQLGRRLEEEEEDYDDEG